MFAFHLFNTVTNHTAVATILFKIDIKWKRRPRPWPRPLPALIVFILKSIYCGYNGFPHETKAAHQILDIKTIEKGTNRQVAQRIQQKLHCFFLLLLVIFHKTKSQTGFQWPSCSRWSSHKKTIYRRVEPWQAPRITSLIPTAVGADVLSHRGVTDVTGVLLQVWKVGRSILLWMSIKRVKIYTIKRCKNVANFCVGPKYYGELNHQMS